MDDTLIYTPWSAYFFEVCIYKLSLPNFPRNCWENMKRLCKILGGKLR